MLQEYYVATPVGGHATLGPRRIAKQLGLIAALLILINIVAGVAHVLGGNRYYDLARMFILDGENNIPTFFSSLLLLAAGLVLASIAAIKTQEADRYAPHWRALSIIFVILAFDEMVSLHEMFNYPIRQLLGVDGVLFFGFVVLAIPLVMILAIIYARFLIHLPSHIRRIFVLAAVLYLGGQIGVEMLSGVYFESNGSTTVAYLLITTVEESLEFSGIILFIYGLLSYAARNLREIRLSFEEAG
ncbi:MAG: hypothetical protein IIB10_09010 [Chloroflexi bacterium]|nr:hypothetical protein [Chloroflexota bacterium]